MAFWLELAALALAEPSLPEGSFVTPRFSLTDGATWTVGAGFVADTPKGPVLVSALRWFGPAAGLRLQLSTEQVRQKASVEAFDALTARRVLRSSVVRALPQATVESTIDDLVAFELAPNRRGRAGGVVPIHPLPLAVGCPPDGSPVFVPGGALDRAQGLSFLPAEVEQCSPRRLTMTFGGAFADPRDLAGAPVLDLRGTVVGMLVDTTWEGSRATSTAISAAGLRAHLLGERLLPEAPPPPPPCAWGTLDTGWAAIPNAWGLDLPGLHAKLLPQWGLSGKDEELVREGLQAAPPLDELFEQISRLSWQDNAGNYPRISELFQRWNGVYAEAGIPLRMTAAAQRQTLAWMTWHIEARGEVQLGDRSVAVQWTGRLDPLNVADPVPSLLDGQTDVVVPLEDVRDARVYDLWGRLDPARKDPLAKPLRAEFEAQLGSEATEVLLRTAPLRSELDAVRVAVAGRSRCSGFGIMRPAWWGVTGDTDARMADVAVSSGRCAPLTTGELARLRKATGALGTESGLADAMTLLVAHVSRAVSIEGAALRLACPDDCAWSAKAPVAKAVGLMDSATRVTAAAHWCDPASWPPSLRANADGLDPCGGADLRTAAAERWPAQWGSARIEVRGLPVRALARWPRDPG